jgi:dihydroorotate dehydrogenase electron transfer subunit
MRIEDFELRSKHLLNEDYFILELSGRQKLPEILPGQFVQIRVDNEKTVFLRRPISVFDVDYRENRLSLLIKRVGAGTEALARLREKEIVNLILPLGNSFSIGSKSEKSLLVGGGVGVAPLLLLARLLKAGSHSFKFLLGYQTQKDIIEKERFASLGEVLITTDDGSYGYEGLVTGHPELSEGTYDRIYCCGPEPMMKAIASMARKQDKFCEVSLENTMACGYGVCLCCVVETDRGNVCTCTEGPVFNIIELKWQI